MENVLRIEVEVVGACAGGDCRLQCSQRYNFSQVDYSIDNLISTSDFFFIHMRVSIA